MTTLGAVTTLANVLTLAILLAGAIAALVQLRHVRAGHQLQSMLEIERSFSEAELQRAFLYVQRELAAKLTQPDYRAELAGRGFIDPRTHPEMAVCNWFNEMGTMIEGGFVTEGVFLDAYGRLVEYYWRLLAPAIGVMRRERGGEQYARFAQLAERARRRRERGRAAYPAGVPRLPLTDPWAEADRRDGVPQP